MKRLETTKLLVGEMREAILDEVKAAGKPWEAMGEFERELIADRIGMRAFSIANECARLIGDELAGAAVRLPAMLESVTTTDAVKAKLKMVGPRRHELARYVGGEVSVLILPDAEDYLGPAPTPKFREVPAEDQKPLFPEDGYTAKGVDDAA